MTAIKAPLLTACRCGKRVYRSEDDARRMEPSGRWECPDCYTFAADHFWGGDEYSDFRCYQCDTRSGSHGEPVEATPDNLARVITPPDGKRRCSCGAFFPLGGYGICNPCRATLIGAPA